MSEEIDYGVDPELVQEFVDESEDLLNDVTNLFITLESDPNDREAIDKIFRSVHTIKGNSAFFNLMKVKSMAHIMEDLMNLVREGAIKFGADVSDVLIRGIDSLKGMLENVRGQKAEVDDMSAYEALLEEITKKVETARSRDPVDLWKAILQDADDLNEKIAGAELAIQEVWKSLFANLKQVCPLAESPGETQSEQASASQDESVSPEETEKAAEKEKDVKAGGASTEAKDTKANKTMRVYESSIDAFLDFVGELVVVGEMYDHIQKRFSEDLGPSKTVADLKKNNETFNELSTALQRSVLDIRRVPIKTLLQRAPRIVRDVATAKKKKIKVFLEGEDVLIDKSLLESVEGPFVHMVRNAADHGVEKPEVRAGAGKDEQGNIWIQVSETDESLFIAIKDDGGGINREVVTKKAVANNLISEEQASVLSDEEVYQLLFAPGFSTAEEITDISGRGVGMDVVKKNIEAIGGQIHIQSALGQGSTFTIEIPKTVCVKIMEGFLVSTRGNRFVLPMVNVGESFRISADEITHTLGEGECIMHHGVIFPVRRLDRILELTKEDDKDKREYIGVILDVGFKDKRTVLLVDEVLGTQQVVIKDIEGLPQQSDVIAGGAVLGDERVAIVLNLESVL